MQMRDTSQMFRDQPLIAGALGIAIGAVLGALLPLSRRENELMGETRDQVVDQAMEYGQQTVQQATDAAKGVATAAAEAATSEAEKQGITGSGGQQESAGYKAQSATGQPSNSDEKLTDESPSANRSSGGTGSASGQYSGDTRS